MRRSSSHTPGDKYPQRAGRGGEACLHSACRPGQGGARCRAAGRQARRQAGNHTVGGISAAAAAVTPPPPPPSPSRPPLPAAGHQCCRRRAAALTCAARPWRARCPTGTCGGARGSQRAPPSPPPAQSRLQGGWGRGGGGGGSGAAGGRSAQWPAQVDGRAASGQLLASSRRQDPQLRNGHRGGPGIQEWEAPRAPANRPPPALAQVSGARCPGPQLAALTPQYAAQRLVRPHRLAVLRAGQHRAW